MNTLPVFALEHYFLQHEHKAELSLCSSGLDSLALSEVLALGDDETLGLWEKQGLGYSEPQGKPLLRQAISALYEGLLPEQVVLFSGAAESIYCGLSALLSPDDHCIVITPCYQSLKAIPESICPTTSVPLRPVEGEWQLDLQAVREAIRHNTRLLVVNFPNNPTGALPGPEGLSGLVELAREFGLTIFSDEVYRGMELAPDTGWPAMVTAYEKGISVGSFSKLFAMPGVRVGWLACRESSVLDRVTGLKHYSTICNGGLGETVALMALRSQQAIISRNRAALFPRYQLMREFLERHAAWFEWIPPRAGCLVFPRLRQGLDAEQFAQALLHQEKVLVLPGSLYDFPGPHLRLSYASKTLPEALVRLERFMARLPEAVC